MKKYILFGAGKNTEWYLIKNGTTEVEYIVDNNIDCVGQKRQGIEIISYQDYKKIADKHTTLITVGGLARIQIEQQLRKDGINRYLLLNRALLNHEKLIVEGNEGRNEAEWITYVNDTTSFQGIRDYVDQMKDNQIIFSNVEIETVNRCNGTCSFCPVNAKIDPRKPMKMSEELFNNIIGQLGEMNYSGRLALFSNDEPFLDSRIIRFSKYAREKVPNARIHMFTNGTLLTMDKFIEIIPCLDELIIDNYDENFKLSKNSEDIVDYIKDNPELQEKVVILVRDPNEVLTTRGGDAPNRREKKSYGEYTCALPFQQLIIRPDGKVSLCCNDPMGKMTMGDLQRESLIDVWYGEKYDSLRKQLAGGRKNIPHCLYCDTFILF